MKITKIGIKWLMVVILSIWVCGNNAMEPRGLMENINDGIKYAGQMLGINTAADVADLVSRAFSATQNINRKPAAQIPEFIPIIHDLPGSMYTLTSANNAQTVESESKQQSQEQMSTYNSSNLLTNVLRLIGFDVNKLGALAINALILIAQAIGSTFAVQALPSTPSSNDINEPYDPARQQDGHSKQNERQKRELRRGTPIDWFLERPTSNMRDLLNTAMDANITQHLIKIVTNTETGDGEGECLKMLLCRSAPFIWGMQKTLQQRIENAELEEKKQPIESKTPTAKTSSTTNVPPKIEAEIFRHMPTLAEYRKHAKNCAKKHGNKCRQIGKQ